MYKYSNKEHTVVTNLDTGASGIHPGNWMWKDYQDWVAAGETTQPWKTEQELKDETLFSGLQAIDDEVSLAQQQPFPFNGHLFYPDTEFIQGVFSALNVLPANYQETWKTADKEADGVTNIYVTLDKAGIAGLAVAYLQFKKTTWSAGEEKKKLLKAAYLGD